MCMNKIVARIPLPPLPFPCPCKIMAILLPEGFPGGSDDRESVFNAGDPSCHWVGRFPGEGNGYLLQYSCLEIPCTEELGGLQFMGLQRVRHNGATNTCTFACWNCPGWSWLRGIQFEIHWCKGKSMSFPGGSVVRNPPATVGDVGSFPGSGRSLQEEMATHSSILAWKILWTEEPGRLQFWKSWDMTE